MKKHRLKDFIGGWFIGNFTPTLVKTDAFEVSVKNYKRGFVDNAHFHKKATEYTVIVQGLAELNGNLLCEGDIIEIEPMDVAEFKALTDVTTVVVKMPSVIGDKYTE